MRLLGLADRLRDFGLIVVEVPGWQDRGDDFDATPIVVVAHHTGTAATAKGDYPSLRIVRDGRSDLPGPLSQVGMGRDGTAYVIAAGKANHAGKGAWKGISTSKLTIGCEAESPGDGTWTEAQREAYPKILAAMTAEIESTAAMVCAHREWALPAGRKPDPTGIDMPTLRARVRDLLNAHRRHSTAPPADPTPTPASQENIMHLLVKHPTKPDQFVVREDLESKVHIIGVPNLRALEASGRYVRVTLTAEMLDAIKVRP